MEKQVLLNKLIERVNTMTDEQIAKVILDVWSNTDVASLLKQNEELKKELSWYKKYTDELVEHKDMVCLPADLKNLREANTALATENEELKKQVEELREVIKQKWYTDIEFDGDKLVASVEEAASKLKYFNASTGNWMTAEKLQQKPESKLKSLEEHNKQTFDAYALANNLNSGFACPKCGEELFYSNPNAALCTHPPQKSVSCNKCNYTGYVYC